MNDIPPTQEPEKQPRGISHYGIPMYKVPVRIASAEIKNLLPLTYEKLFFSLNVPDSCDHITYELPFKIENTKQVKREEVSQGDDCP